VKQRSPGPDHRRGSVRGDRKTIRSAAPLGGNESVSRELVAAHEPFHPCAEEMRALRTQLLIRGPTTGTARILGSSVRAWEGAVTGCHLAVGVCAARRTHVLIDATCEAAPASHLRRDRPFGLSAVCPGALIADGGAGSGVRPAVRCCPAARARPTRRSCLRDRRNPAARGTERFRDHIFDTPGRRYAGRANRGVRAGNALVLARKDHTPGPTQRSGARARPTRHAHVARVQCLLKRRPGLERS